jgi:signal transduction histidine kinase
MRSYQPELLRLYGATIGTLTSLKLVKQQEFDLQLEQERVRMLETFITDVGHEFKTPLSIINTKSYLIERVREETNRAELVKTVQEQVMVINSMIDDMLHLVRLGSRLVLDLHAIHLSGLIQQVIQGYASLAAARQLRWDIDLEPAYAAPLDPDHMRRAISEVIDNAIQYSEPGGRISIRLNQYESEIGIRIQDTGIGISPAHLDKIFNRLYRVDQSRSLRGTGLGLPIAKLIVEAHKGRITVASIPGEGSTFEILLPRQ